MFDLKRKRSRFSFTRSRVVIGVLAVAVVFLGNATLNAYKDYNRAKQKEERVSQQLEELRDRKQAIAADLERLQTEKGIEAELRNRYNVGKAGEGIIVVVPGEEPAQQTQDTSESFGASLWQAVKSVFSF